MRLAIPLLVMTVAISAAAQEKPKPNQDPFVFEMPKQTGAAKPKDEVKSKAPAASAKSTAAPAESPARAGQPASSAEPAAAPAAASAPAVPETAAVGLAPDVEPATPVVAPASVVSPEPATKASPSVRARKNTVPDPLNFRLPNSEQAPHRGQAKKRNPFAFELPEPKPDAVPKS